MHINVHCYCSNLCDFGCCGCCCCFQFQFVFEWKSIFRVNKILSDSQIFWPAAVLRMCQLNWEHVMLETRIIINKWFHYYRADRVRVQMCVLCIYCCVLLLCIKQAWMMCEIPLRNEKRKTKKNEKNDCDHTRSWISVFIFCISQNNVLLFVLRARDVVVIAYTYAYIQNKLLII